MLTPDDKIFIWGIAFFIVSNVYSAANNTFASFVWLALAFFAIYILPYLTSRK